MYTAALFDMDGLLIDSERAIGAAWMELARRWDVGFSDAIYAETVGLDAAQSNAVLARAFGSLEAVQTARHEVKEILRSKTPAERFPLKSGAKPLLEILHRQGIPCAVASSSARHEIEERLSAVGVLNFFQAVAGGDEVACGKPDPAVYRLAAERLGVLATDCLAFEDSLNGARAVLAAGAGLVLVPDLIIPTADIIASSVRVLHSLDEAIPEVPRWFVPRA